jgi:hypothetical protein
MATSHTSIRRGAPGADRALLGVVVATLLAACGGHRADAAPDAGKPVAECVAYQQMLARCSGVDVPVATQANAIPKNDADRDRLATLCAANLDRLSHSCH